MFGSGTPLQDAVRAGSPASVFSGLLRFLRVPQWSNEYVAVRSNLACHGSSDVFRELYKDAIAKPLSSSGSSTPIELKQWARSSFLNLIKAMMWRNTKATVGDSLIIPPQRREVRKLEHDRPGCSIAVCLLTSYCLHTACFLSSVGYVTQVVSLRLTEVDEVVYMEEAGKVMEKLDAMLRRWRKAERKEAERRAKKKEEERKQREEITEAGSPLPSALTEEKEEDAGDEVMIVGESHAVLQLPLTGSKPLTQHETDTTVHHLLQLRRLCVCPQVRPMPPAFFLYHDS